MSWRHWCYGRAALAREDVRHQITQGSVTRIAGAVRDDWDRWLSELTPITRVR